jgi:hypothetical protein
MQIKVKNTDKLALVLFDTNGNLYFKYENKLYDIEIHKNYNLSCELSNYIEEENKQIKINYGTLKLSTDPKSLKGKTQKEYLKELKKIEEEENNEIEYEDEDEEDDYSILEKYYPEDLEYFENNNKILDNLEDYEISCSFYKEPNLLKEDVQVYTLDDIHPLYETLIYNQDLSSGDLMFKTKLNNTIILYRLRLYKSGEIAFRPISDKEVYYELSVNENNLLYLFTNQINQDNKTNINFKNLISLEK